jgi:hypothetical protein
MAALGERIWSGKDWICLAQDRDQWMALVNAVVNILFPLNAGEFLSGRRTGGLSKKQTNSVALSPQADYTD